MEHSVEYQIFIGCSDPQLNSELVDETELRAIVTSFFKRNEVDFTVLSAKGGYLTKAGWFITENTLCIDIIGSSDMDIIKLARSLSSYMNQECSLVIRNAVQVSYQ